MYPESTAVLVRTAKGELELCDISELKFNCPVCYRDDLPLSKAVTKSECTHMECVDCMRNFVSKWQVGMYDGKHLASCMQCNDNRRQGLSHCFQCFSALPHDYILNERHQACMATKLLLMCGQCEQKLFDQPGTRSEWTYWHWLALSSTFWEVHFLFALTIPSFTITKQNISSSCNFCGNLIHCDLLGVGFAGQ